MASLVNATEAATPKGERTQEKILEAATRLFAERGYDGASIREIEQAAGVNRGLITYHFGTKDDLWKAMAGRTFMPYLDDLRGKLDLLRALDGATRQRMLIEHFIRTSAARPHMNQIMIRENFAQSWRTDWLVRGFLLPMRELSDALGEDAPLLRLLNTDPHTRYALLGACNLAFSLPCEVRALFQEDAYDEAFIEAHVARVTELFETWFNQDSNKESPHV